MLSARQRRDLDQVIGEHIAEDGLLIFSGEGFYVDNFRRKLRRIVDSALLIPPLMVVYETKTFGHAESVVQPLRDLVDIPSLGLTEMGHRADFILNRVFQRVGVLVPG
ncbi:MAG: hypothetical protein KJ732_08225 [Candidatus Margulisbacteria bacterium]|nr:hypothetical protein [Candidatus Margulisiibacteriota bacterium]